MENITKHSDIINLWATVGKFAEDISMKETTCRSWKLRNSIPSKNWSNVVKAANDRGYELSFELLASTCAT